MPARLARSEKANNCATCAARDIGICGHLSDQSRAHIAAKAQIVRFPANQRICESLCQKSQVVVLRSGHIRIQHHNFSGRRQIIAIAKPGQTVGREHEDCNNYELETITPVSVCRFGRLDFERMIRQEPEMLRALCKQSLARLDEARQLTWVLGALNSNARLRSFLLAARHWMPWAPQPDGTGVLTMTLPRKDIADLLATTPETISRLLHQFQEDRLIDMLCSKTFRLRDLTALAEGLDKISAD